MNSKQGSKLTSSSIIVVPSAWAQHSLGQVKSGCSWLKPLLQSDLKDTRVFLFTYALQTDGSSLWDQLLSQGTSLVAGLRQSRTQPEVIELAPSWHLKHSLTSSYSIIKDRFC